MTRARIAARIAAIIAAAVTLGGAGLALRLRAQETPPPPPAQVPAPVVGAPAVAPGPLAPPAATVKIVFITVPMKKAMVFWGKKRLGAIAPRQPLVVQRPRDSGPLDVVVRADGYLPVQTRAYTFADSKVAVKITPVDQKNTLLGYREEVPPDGGVPDGGAGSVGSGVGSGAPSASGPDGGLR